MVVGVSDEEFGQRVAAAVCLSAKNGGKKLILDTLRADLRSKLAGYKMPTVLRIVDGELPKSGMGKVQKKILGPKYFPEEYEKDPDVQVWKRGNRSKL